MKKEFPEGFEPAYYLSHKADYAKANGYDTPNVMIGLYHQDGGCMFEFRVKWDVIGKRTSVMIQLYNDSWEAFTTFPELFKELAEISNKGNDRWEVEMRRAEFSDDQLVEILNRLGFRDKTTYPALDPGIEMKGEQLGAFRFKVNGAIYQGVLEDAQRIFRTLKSAQGKTWIEWVDQNYHLINNQ